MASTRDLIRMTAEERRAFFDEPHKLQLATIGPDGWPHVVTMYFAPVGEQLAFWTYKTSQKARNLERDPRVTCLIETGDGYDQLVGVMVKGHATCVTEFDQVRSIGEQVHGRYLGETGGALRGFLDEQAKKRNAYLVMPDEVASWDHRKLVALNHTPETALPDA